MTHRPPPRAVFTSFPRLAARFDRHSPGEPRDRARADAAGRPRGAGLRRAWQGVVGGALLGLALGATAQSGGAAQTQPLQPTRSAAQTESAAGALQPASATPAAPAAAAIPAPRAAPAALPAASITEPATESTAEPATATHAPRVPPEQAGRLPPARQLRWLREAAQSGLLASLDDARLHALFASLDPQTVPRYIAEGPNGYPSYEFTMWRSERIHGDWPGKPDHMLVRLTREPLRIYAKWLPDGAHAGQELIYDSTRRADEMYGHLGGLLNVMSIWTSLTGSLARAQSNHDVRDLGTEYIAHQFLAEGRKFAAAGITRPQDIAVETVDGVRVVAFTFEAPTGQPEYYAKKEVLGLDLRHPWFRSVESYGNDGRIFERIVFERITPKSFDDSTFDPKNRAYRF